MLEKTVARKRSRRILNTLILSLALLLGISPLYTNCTPGFKSQSLEISSADPRKQDDDPSTTTTTSTSTTTSTIVQPGTPTTSTTLPAAPIPLVNCASAQFEFPLATHWSNTINGFSEGANDQMTLYNPDQISTRHIYNYGLLPKLNQYIADRYEFSKIEDSEFRNLSLTTCSQSGVAVELRRPLSFSNWSVARQKILEGRGSIQTLHALIIDNNLVTVYLPPNWKKTDARGKYPILVNGFYDLKAGLLEGVRITKAMGLAWKSSTTPFIGIYWNGGGGIGSRTVNPQARASFNKILQQVAEHFGGDPQRVMIYGGSRGGMTSLAMASNPEKYPYKIIAAYVAVPTIDFNSAGRLTGPTVPYLLGAAEWTIGLLDTWKKSFRYPSNGSGMDGFTRDEAHMYILTGSRDPNIVASQINFSSPTMLNALKQSGTQVFYEAGSHDYICPWVDQFEFIQKLTAYGIPFESRVNYLTGHSTSETVTTSENFARIMTKISKYDFNGIFQIGKRSYYRHDYRTGNFVPVAADRFTFEVPRYQIPSADGHVIMTGIPGTQVEYGGKFNGSDYAVQTAVLNSQGYSVTNMSSLAAGTYTVTFIRIKKPGMADWKNLDLNHSTTGWNRGSLVLEVLAADPDGNQSASQLGEITRKAYLNEDLSGANNGYSSVSYGIAEAD